MQTSIIVPIYNEVENLPLLVEQVGKVMDELPGSSELILVNDGSTDGSTELMNALTKEEQRIVALHFRRNYGQTAAMQAGLEQARGEYLVTLDGDLQNEPADIPMMIRKLEQGYDLIHGWRKNRQDTLVTRKIPSRIANWLISKVTRFPIHDLGCTLKVMRREIAEELETVRRDAPVYPHIGSLARRQVRGSGYHASSTSVWANEVRFVSHPSRCVGSVDCEVHAGLLQQPYEAVWQAGRLLLGDWCCDVNGYGRHEIGLEF